MHPLKPLGSLLLALATLISCTNVESVKTVNPTRLGLLVGYEDTESKSNISGEPSSTEDSTGYYLDVEAGHRVSPNLELGGLVGYRSEETKFSYTSDSEFELLNIGPKARVYVVGDGNFQPWVSLAAGWSYYDGKDAGLSVSDDGYFLQGGIGVSYFPSRWVAFEAGLFYEKLSLNVDFDEATPSGVVNRSGDVDTTSTYFMIGISTFF